MEETRQYRVVAWWTSGRTGIAKSDSAPNAIHFTAPPEFGGLQGRWTPEELLLGAVGGCFTTTFRTIAAHSNFEYADLEVETQGTAAKTADGYRFGEIVIRPRLTISSEEERNRGVDLLKKAKALCLVSRALGVTQTFQPLIAVGKTAPVG
jgi:organic hydroperoxide reductase OsmC/OhrA